MRSKLKAKPRSQGVLTRFRVLPPPVGVSPLVRRFYAIRNEQRMATALIVERSGVSEGTIRSWSKRREPGIGTFDAALNTLGYCLAIVPIK